MNRTKPVSSKKPLVVLVLVLLLGLMGYFFLTPRGSISRKLLVHNPVYAFTYRAEISTSPDGETVYLLADPIHLSETGNDLDRWTVRRNGVFYSAEYGYA